MLSSSKTLSILFIAVNFIGHSATADENHYRNILIGERAADLGGAYTAVSDTPAGLYYNPAGVVYAAGTSVTASVSTYDYFQKSYSRGLSGLSDWERRSTNFVPSFFGVVRPIGKGVFGMSYAMPDSVTEDQDLEYQDTANNINRYTINFNNRDRTFHLGPSYAFRVNDNVSVGASLYFHYREREWISNQLAMFTSGSYQWTNTYFQSNEYGYRPVVGAMWSPREKWALGAAVSKISIFSGRTDSQVTTRSSGNVLSYTKSASEAKREHPLNFALGAAYFSSAALMVAIDVSYYESFNDPIYGKCNSVTNVGLGAEYYVQPTLALRAGLFTDFANTPDLVSGGLAQPEHVDYVGGSVSITHFNRNAALSLGCVYRSGEGKAQVVGGSSELQDVSYTGASLFLTSSYSN